ncbi:MAG: hemerythrin family protein [Alphaproteobacteria bacterium]|nr:hemerythrin family protein [Alphaproteobacteria bacterium]
MAIVAWREQMSLNYLPLDQEHQAFLKVVNYSITAAHAGDFDGMERVFEACYDYVRNHFSHEEDIMERISFPDMKAHMQAHRTFIKNISEFRQKYEKAATPVKKKEAAVKTADFLSLWLIGHILSRDKLLKPYLVRLRNLPPRMNYDSPLGV